LKIIRSKDNKGYTPYFEVIKKYNQLLCDVQGITKNLIREKVEKMLSLEE
jgi:hypothetical protein